jgi:hypothetical protein
MPVVAAPVDRHAASSATIALRGPRDQGNSVFVDGDFMPWADQWSFLAAVRRIGRSDVERVVQDAERRGRLLGVRLPPQEDGDDEPWTAPPSRRRPAPFLSELPQSLELVLGNQICIAKDGLQPGLRNQLLRLAAFQNPEFYKAQAMRLSTYDKPRIIACAEDHPQHVGLPRGCLEDVRQTLDRLGVRSVVRDKRHIGRQLDATFRGELRDQVAAASAMLAHDTGVLAATTAFGKTVVAAWLIAQRGVNTLILVHRRQLLDQWSRGSRRSSGCRPSQSAASAVGARARLESSTSPPFRASSRKGSWTIVLPTTGM